MNLNASNVISTYLKEQDDIFTVEQFWREMKENGVKMTKAQAEDLLRTSNYVFPLVRNEFITRTGVFLGRWFSFKPSKEEIEKGYFLIGHRCMPFANPEVSPDNITVYSSSGEVESETVTFSMNTAMDCFALFGEGYVIPYIINDKGNESIPLTSIQYSLPSEINLTAWSLKKVTGGKEFIYGDRILCRIIDWEKSIVEMKIQPVNHFDLVVSEAAIEREQWYSDFENGLLECFERHGPADSIEEQLAFLFLENQEQLCIRNCGSVEEFLSHTTKIGFEAYGVETRIWKKGEMVPFTGAWKANGYTDDLILSEMALNFSPQVIDAFLEDNIYEKSKNGKTKTNEQIFTEIFPQVLHMSAAERKIVLLNIEKRNDILEENYNRFSDYPIAGIRKRILNVFSQVSILFCSIGCSGLKAEEFPQQELVILSQLYGHMIRLLEDLENVFARDSFPIDDVSLSLDGMEDTFEDIRGTLKQTLETKRYKGYGLVKNEE